MGTEDYVRGELAIKQSFQTLRETCDPRGFDLLAALEETMLHDFEILALAGAIVDHPGHYLFPLGGGLGAP